MKAPNALPNLTRGVRSRLNKLHFGDLNQSQICCGRRQEDKVRQRQGVKPSGLPTGRKKITRRPQLIAIVVAVIALLVWRVSLNIYVPPRPSAPGSTNRLFVPGTTPQPRLRLAWELRDSPHGGLLDVDTRTKDHISQYGNGSCSLEVNQIQQRQLRFGNGRHDL